MTSEPDLPPSEDSHGPTPLDYQSPGEPGRSRAADDDAPRRPEITRQITSGALLSFIVIIALVTLWFMENLNLTPGPRPPLRWVEPTIVSVIAVVAVLLATLLVRYRYGWRWFPLGIVIGIALAGLAEGLCFAR